MTDALPRSVALLLRAPPARRSKAARRVLREQSDWPTLRGALAAALRNDPGATGTAVAALVLVVPRERDAALHGRLRTFQAHGAHRAGRLDEAADLYASAASALRAAGLPDERRAAEIARVDALATTGRLDDALALAKRLAPSVRGPSKRREAAVLAVNRANALRLRGDVDEAAAQYRRAVRTFEALNDERRAAATRLNEGVARVETGDVTRGRALIADAAAALDRLGFADLATEARANLAWADVHAGRLGDGIRGLEALAGEHRDRGLSRRESVCRMDLSDALRRAGDDEAARREALRAAAGFERAAAPAERAEALVAALLATPAGDPTRRILARDAARAAKASGRESIALRVDLARAAEGGTAGPGPAAIAQRARRLGQKGLEADARLVEGGLALEAGRIGVARRVFELAREGARTRPWTRIAAEAGLADLDARRPGGSERSLSRLRALGVFHESVRAGLPGAWLRSRFAADRLDPFLVRVDVLVRRGKPRDLREAASVLDALAARRVLATTGPRRDRRTERIRARLEVIYDRIARGEGPSRGGEPAVASLARRASALERAFVAHRRAAERKATGAEPPIRVRSSDRPKDVTSIHLWRWGSEVRALVGDSTGQRAVEHVTSLETWSRWRDGFAFHARAYAGLGKHAAQAAGAADALCEAVAAHVLPRLHVTSWERCVHVTSDPALADLPWELLLLGGCRLGRFHEILRTPLGSARPARAQRGEGAAVLGVGGPEIAAVHGEVARVAALLGTSRVSVGASATRAALAKALSTASIVHVAGHGWDASEAPLLGGLRLADGWFAAEDLPSSISADLVVLGACRSGKAAGPAARAWGGFVARLLSGGARRVVWTSDDVEDRAAATFAEAYHRERTTSADGLAFGRALDRVATVSGHPGSVLPFRLSGVVS